MDANSEANPKPPMPAIFSVLALKLDSCPPPWISGFKVFPLLINSPPIPLGPYNLCADIDNKSRYRYAQESDSYFCSQGCKNEWLNENMSAIEMGIPVPFITHRRITEGYEKTTNESRYGYRYTSIQKIGVDNDNENDRIIT